MSDIEAELKGEYAIVNQVVRLYGAAFKAHGFELDRVNLKATLKLKLPTVLGFHFWNEKTAMVIKVSFFPAREGLNGAFTATIVKHKRLDIETYLKLHGREELTKFFTYRDPATDVRGFAEFFLQMLSGLLDKELKPILDGKTFEETPIDWQGYK